MCANAHAAGQGGDADACARALGPACLPWSARGLDDASAQASDFPNRPITLVVPLAPGGSNDILARLVGQKLERKFGKPVIIENRPGAGGITAALGVVRGAPDGYTMITASSTMMSLNVTIRKQMPYDPRKDLTPIAMTVRTPFVLVVNPALPVHSVADLVKLAREKKGAVVVRHAGPGDVSSAERGDPAQHVRSRVHPRPLQGNGAGAERRRRRAHRLHVCRCSPRRWR